MKSYVFHRVLVILTVAFGILFIFSNPDVMPLRRVILNFSIFMGLCFATYKMFKNLSKEEVDKILFNDFLKKINLDINDEN